MRKRRRDWTFSGLVAAMTLAAVLAMPSDASAHYVSSYDAAYYLVQSNYGGNCGAGWNVACGPKYGASCYYGGDGICRTGEHSLQLEGNYGETVWGAWYRSCSGVYRMYHYEYAEKYWDTCH
jgi:hypothetical protein